MNKQQLIRRLHEDLRISRNYYKTSRTDEISEVERNIAIGQLKEAGIVAKDKRRSDKDLLLDAITTAFQKLAPRPVDPDKTINKSEKIVEAILKDPYGSLADIAKKCGAHPSTVAKYRTQLRHEGRCPRRLDGFR